MAIQRAGGDVLAGHAPREHRGTGVGDRGCAADQTVTGVSALGHRLGELSVQDVSDGVVGMPLERLSRACVPRQQYGHPCAQRIPALRRRRSSLAAGTRLADRVQALRRRV